MPGLHFRSMTTTGVMPVLATGRTVGSPVAVCWTPVSVMIAPVLRLSGRDTASTPGKVDCSDMRILSNIYCRYGWINHCEGTDVETWVSDCF